MDFDERTDLQHDPLFIMRNKAMRMVKVVSTQHINQQILTCKLRGLKTNATGLMFAPILLMLYILKKILTSSSSRGVGPDNFSATRKLWAGQWAAKRFIKINLFQSCSTDIPL